MLQKSHSIIIKYIKYADADLIVHAFTRDLGMKTFYVKGVLKSKGGKLKKSWFQPLNQLEIVGFYNSKGQLNQIREAVLLHQYTTLHTDIVKQSLTLFISEVLMQVLQEETVDEELFDFISDSLRQMDQMEKVANFHLSFLSQLLKYLGFYPIVDEKAPYFDLTEGKFVPVPISPNYIQIPELDNFTLILKSDYATCAQISLTREQRLFILNKLLDYMALHLHNFKRPHSLDVFQEVFQ